MSTATGKNISGTMGVQHVHRLFELQKIKTTDNLAVIFGETQSSPVPN